MRPADSVNACGLKCPEPLMRLYAALNRIEAGELVRFEADDPTSLRDVRRMCGFLHHRIIAADEEKGGACVLLIRKKEEA